MTDTSVVPDPSSTALSNKPIPDFLGAAVADTTALCQSGGGFRAMLYHVGSLIRMNEMGMLRELATISDVSGAAIVGAYLAYAWPKLRFDAKGIATNFNEEFAAPLIQFAHIHVDVPAFVIGWAKRAFSKHQGPAMELANIYDKHLFHFAGLQDLPDYPNVRFQATNLQTLGGFEFSKRTAIDDRVGVIDRPTFRLSRAVAASSAFPPFLSPEFLNMERQKMVPRPQDDQTSDPFRRQAVLVDGGVRDNMGVLNVMMENRTILISNAGALAPQVGDVTGRILGQFARVVAALQDQAEQAHSMILDIGDRLGQRNVAMWKIQTPVTQYGAEAPLDLSVRETNDAAGIRTRLAPFTNQEIALLLRAGYAGTDACLRAHGFGLTAPKGDFGNLPRPDTGACVYHP